MTNDGSSVQMAGNKRAGLKACDGSAGLRASNKRAKLETVNRSEGLRAGNRSVRTRVANRSAGLGTSVRSARLRATNRGARWSPVTKDWKPATGVPQDRIARVQADSRTAKPKTDGQPVNQWCLGIRRHTHREML